MSSFSRRPHKDETEEDILREQEAFLKAKNQPSAQLVRCTRPSDKRKSESDGGIVDKLHGVHKDIPPKRTCVAKEVDSDPEELGVDRSSSPEPDIEVDAEQELERQDHHITKMLSDIVEREFVANLSGTESSQPVAGGFPVAHKRQMGIAPQKGDKKMSIFAQQFTRDSHLSARTPPSVADATSSLAVDPISGDVVEHWHTETMSSPCPSSSTAAADIKDVDMNEIGRENECKLSSLSEAEILSKQKELLVSLDPGLIAFLKSKRSSKPAADKHPQKKSCEAVQVTATAHLRSAEFSDLSDQQMSDAPVDIPVKPQKDWLHMDTVEHEKLAWMKDLSPPSAGDNKTGKPARFDFDGHLVSADADIPVHVGLHHHGLEPERAGYTLEELFQLSRSVHVPQRCLALTVISRIILNARRGEFHDCLSTGIIPSLLDAGLVFILRWALDDATETALLSAIGAIHSLLVCTDDEIGADRVFSWYQGHTVPCLSCPLDDVDAAADDNEQEQETDADVVKKDVVVGLLRTSLLERLHYVVDKLRPPAPVVVQIFDILTRIARHSLQAATQVFGCTKLLEIVFTHFLPLTWKPTDVSKLLTDAYGYPLPSALKLLRVLATAGRQMAAMLISRYHLMSRVIRYVAQLPSELVLNIDQARDLCIESWRTWKTLLHYGLAVDCFSGDYCAIVVQWLSRCCAVDFRSSAVDCQFACLVVGVIETLLHSTPGSHAGHVANTDRPPSSESGGLTTPDVPVRPTVEWNQVAGFVEPIQLCVKKSLSDFVQQYFETKYDLTFAACCLNFLATYYSLITYQPGYCAVDVQRQCEAWAELLLPCVKSQAFSLALQYVRNYSIFLHEAASGSNPEDARNLPCLGALVGAPRSTCPVLHDRNSVHFLVAVTRLLVVLGKLSRYVVDKLYGLVLENEETLQYVHKVCRLKMSPFAANYFSKFENQLQFLLITMARIKASANISDDGSGGSADIAVYHLLSLNLLTQLHVGDEHIAHDLLSHVTFNVDFLRDVRNENETPAADLDEMLTLRRTVPFTSATQKPVDVSPSKLVQDINAHLPALRAAYLEVAPVSPSALMRSRHQMVGSPTHIDSLLSGPVGQLLVPLDWCFLPLVGLYSNAVSGTSVDGTQDSVSPRLVAMVTNALRAVYLLERWRPLSLTSVSHVVKLSRLMCTFLAGSDLFLDTVVHWYLAELMRLYCKPVYLDRMDLRQPVPGLASFYDFYAVLVNQFEAVSFGDSLFACYVLLPLQQQHSVSLRKLVWGERVTILRSLSIAINELVIPLERFLSPEESNVDLLQLYFQALLSEAVTPRWSPVMYLVAVHHLNRFIYTVASEHQLMKRTMIRRIVALKDDRPLKRHLLFYKKPHDDCEYNMELYDVLPQIRLATLDAAAKKH